MSQTSEQLWAGRQSGAVAPITVRMGESIALDIELYREDLRGSVAHARMLAQVGVLTAAERDAIIDGLRIIRGEIEAGRLPLRPELEDIHTHVETRLGELIGPAAKRLHTARSRNDQIAVDTHLYVRRACNAAHAELLELLATLVARAEEHIDVTLPGYTHLQVAQPIRLAHHLLAHFWGLSRDLDRFRRANESALRLPLGSGAMAGVNYPTDREFLRTELNFREIYANSMDAVASRDHILDFLYATASFVTRASRVAEELILWSSVEFGFVSLPDALTTGSSIMPQKKNPDLAELIRGKTGRTQGNLYNLFTNLKALPLTYNRDLQEDRQPLIDSERQRSLVTEALTAMIAGARFDAERMRASLDRGFAAATDLADALVNEKGVPFREAHHLAGRLVGRAAETGRTLTTIDAAERAAVSEFFADEDFYRRAVDLAASADKKASYGGTARVRIEEQLGEARAALAVWRQLDLCAPNLDF